MNIGNAIKTIRKKEKLKQKEYAKRIGITQTYLSLIENGYRVPSMDVINGIANDLSIPVALLFWFGVEEKDIKPQKIEAYRILKPCLDTLIENII